MEGDLPSGHLFNFTSAGHKVYFIMTLIPLTIAILWCMFLCNIKCQLFYPSLHFYIFSNFKKNIISYPVLLFCSLSFKNCMRVVDNLPKHLLDSITSLILYTKQITFASFKFLLFCRINSLFLDYNRVCLYIVF